MAKRFDASIEAGRLKQVLDSVGVLVDDCKMGIGSKGVTVKATDKAGVGVLHLQLEENAFTKYDASGGVIVFDIEYLSKSLEMVEGDATVRLEADSQDGQLEISSDNFDCKAPLFDPESLKQDSRIDPLEYTTKVKLDYADFKRGVEAAEMAQSTVDAEHLSLIVPDNVDKLIIDTEQDFNEVSVGVPAEDLQSLEGEPAVSKYSINYFKDVKKATPENTEIDIQFSEEFPVKIEYEFADGTGEVKYVIAPRVESNA